MCYHIAEPISINQMLQQFIRRLIIALVFTMRLINHNRVRVVYNIIFFPFPYEFYLSAAFNTPFKFADRFKPILFRCVCMFYVIYCKNIIYYNFYPLLIFYNIEFPLSILLPFSRHTVPANSKFVVNKKIHGLPIQKPWILSLWF